MALDMLAPADNFIFKGTAHQGTVSTPVLLGDRVETFDSVELDVKVGLDTEASNLRIRLLRDGDLVNEKNGLSLKYTASTAGCYRVEVDLFVPGLFISGAWHTWIYANPICLSNQMKMPTQRWDSQVDGWEGR